jgi:BMFP domain-containing protein YqiC
MRKKSPFFSEFHIPVLYTNLCTNILQKMLQTGAFLWYVTPLSNKRNTMSAREKIADDIARAAGGAIGLISGAAKQANAALRSRVDDMAQNMNLVPREDFEKLELMLIQSREEQESLKKRVEALEHALLNLKK